MPRPAGPTTLASRESLVVRAFRKLMVDSPGGWYSASEVREAIAGDIGLGKDTSTVREIWRLGRKALRAKGYLGARVAKYPSQPQIEYSLEMIDARFSLPMDDFVALEKEGQARFFSPPALTEAEARVAQKRASEGLSAVPSEIGEMFVDQVSTDRLEEELLRRLRLPVAKPAPRLSVVEQALADVLSPRPPVGATRPPSAKFMRRLQQAVKGSAKLPSRRSTEQRTPNRRRGAPRHPRRGRPSRFAVERRGRPRAS